MVFAPLPSRLPLRLLLRIITLKNNPGRRRRNAICLHNLTDCPLADLVDLGQGVLDPFAQVVGVAVVRLVLRVLEVAVGVLLVRRWRLALLRTLLEVRAGIVEGMRTVDRGIICLDAVDWVSSGSWEDVHDGGTAGVLR